MPNLFAAQQAQSTPGGYLTNRIVTSSAQAPALTPDVAYAVDTQQKPDDEPWVSKGLKYMAAAPVDVVDTVGSLFPGVARGQIDDTVYNSLGLPGYAQWVRENKAGVEVASGILGSVVTSAAAEFLVGRLAASGFAAATGIGRAFSPTVGIVANAERAASAATLDAAVAGNTLRWYQGANFTANLGYTAAKVGAGTLKAGVSEVAIAAALHNNTAVWSDDMGTNLLFAGLGLGFGAVGGALGARAHINRWANSSAVKDAFATAADPGKYERIMADIPLSGNTAIVAPKETSILTAMMLNARRDDEAAASAAGTARPSNTRVAIQSETKGEADKVLQTITIQGDEHIAHSGFSIKGTSEGRQLAEALSDDPTILYGAASVARIAPEAGLGLTLAARDLSIDAKMSDPHLTVRDRVKLMAAKLQQPLVILNKSLLTPNEATPFTTFAPKQTVVQRTAKGVNEVTWKAPLSGKNLTLREDGLLNIKWESLTVEDLLSVTDAMNNLIPKMKATNTVLTLPVNPHFSQIDFAVEYAKRGGSVDWLKKAGFTTIEDAQIDSLKQKYNYVGKMPSVDAHTRFRFNLPMPTSSERATDPNGIALKALLRASTKPGVTLADLRNVKLQLARLSSLSYDAKQLTELDGDMLNFNRGRDKKWMAPVVGFFDDAPQKKWSTFDLAENIAEVKALRIKTMTSATRKAPLVSTIAQTIMQHPATKSVMQLSGLADSQINGTSNIIGATGAQFLTQAMRFRNSAALLGAQQLRRVVNRMTEMRVDEVIKKIAPYTDQLTSVSGQKSRVLLNQYYSLAGGWDIAKAVQEPDGTWAFQLKKDSITNAARLGRDVRVDDFVMNPRTNEKLVLDDLGNDARMTMEGELKQLLAERNVVRTAMGLDPIKPKPFYVPPPSTRGKFVGFTLDAANRVVPGGAIISDSRAAFETESKKLTALLPAGHRFLTQEQIHRFADLWESAKMDFIDPTSMAGPAKAQTGKLLGSAVNPNAFEDTLHYLKRGYEQVANGTVHNVFDAQLKVSRIRAAAEESTKGVVPGAKSIWHSYEETLLGIPGHANPTGATKILSEADKWIDAGIAAAWPATTGVIGAARVSRAHLRDLFDKVGLKPSGAIRSFNDLAATLGPHTPFKDAMDYAEYTHGAVPPWKSKDVARHVNRIGAGVILRWLEIPHAAMNMAGIITNMPGLLNAKNVPMLGRIGNVPVVDQVKIMAKGFGRMFREGNTPDWAMMVRNGDTTQDVAELHQQLSLLKGKSQFMRLVTGDPTSKSAWRRKGIEGVASIIADTSESLSRRWAHFTGLELADYHGITGLEARHNFARQIANDTIANYDPLNRPEIFQSSLGSLYGLFMSYTQNYYQRMFRWMEDGDYKAVGSSLAAQASMFGFMGLPGSRQLAALMGGDEKGDNLVDRIYARFGPAVGSVVANGGFEQLVTLFGLPAVALHTRGDINFRHPSLDFATSGVIQLPPGLEVVKDIASSMFEIAGKSITPGSGMTARNAAEVMARNMPSRVMRGVIGVLGAGGDEVDAYGNVTTDTNSVFETVYRLMGLRSARQQAQVEAYYSNQKAQAIDAARMDSLRSTTRSLIRDGNYERLGEAFQGYVDAGGNPTNYSSWIRNLVQEATTSRAQNQLLRTLRNPSQQVLARRIQMYTGAYE